MTEKILKGSKTEQNLINAFAGESQARNRYSFFAKQAKKDGYEQIAEIFLITAENEKEHAKLFYEHIGNTVGHVNSDYPFELGTTKENLESAINGEKEEWSILYPEGEKVAREEGFDEIAETFHHVVEAEKHHEKRYSKLLENVKDGKVFETGEVKIWKCRNCGHIVVGTKAPEVCPVCSHPKAYFEIKAENY